jgi:3D (Asp-Asp-Asp) domain-containing protein
LKSKIISAERAKIAAPPAQKGKIVKRRAATEAHGLGTTASGVEKEGTVLWEVVTEDTVIFPEGDSIHNKE